MSLFGTREGGETMTTMWKSLSNTSNWPSPRMKFTTNAYQVRIKDSQQVSLVHSGRNAQSTPRKPIDLGYHVTLC